MGKKSDRIDELTAELEATKILLRGFGDTVGVVIDAPVTMVEIPRLTREFADRLRGSAPIAVVPARRKRTGRDGWDTFDDDVDRQIDRLEEQGLTRRDGEAGDDSSGDDSEPLTTIADIAREVGVVAESPADTLRLILAEIIRIKNSGSDLAASSDNKFLTKGDTLGEAVAHAHHQNQHLRDGVTQARTVLGRVAAVMQVGQWDADGTEILERAQRYEGWKHALKRRIKELLAATPDRPPASGRIAEELQTHLDTLMTARERADWNKAKATWVARAAAAAKDAVLIEPYPFTFRNSDLAEIRHALAEIRHVLVSDGGRERNDELMHVFGHICDSIVASDDFVRLMNRDILPILARQRQAQRVPQYGSETSETSGTPRDSSETPETESGGTTDTGSAETARRPPKMGALRESEVVAIPVILDELGPAETEGTISNDKE